MASRATKLPKGTEQFLQQFRKRTGQDQVAERSCREALERVCRKLESKPVSPGHLSLKERLVLHLLLLVYTSEPEPLEYGNRQRFKYRELKRIAESAKQLITQVERLKQTNLVLSLQLDQTISGLIDVLAPTGEVVKEPSIGLPAVKRTIGSRDPSLDRLRAELQSVMRLPELAKRHLNKKQPAATEILQKLFRFLKTNTGSYCDEEIVELLAPFDLAHLTSVESVRMWRSRLARASKA